MLKKGYFWFFLMKLIKKVFCKLSFFHNIIDIKLLNLFFLCLLFADIIWGFVTYLGYIYQKWKKMEELPFGRVIYSLIFAKNAYSLRNLYLVLKFYPSKALIYSGKTLKYAPKFVNYKNNCNSTKHISTKCFLKILYNCKKRFAFSMFLIFL